MARIGERVDTVLRRLLQPTVNMVAGVVQPLARGYYRFALANMIFQIRLLMVLTLSGICAAPFLLSLSRQQGHEADVVRRQSQCQSLINVAKEVTMRVYHADRMRAVPKTELLSSALCLNCGLAMVRNMLRCRRRVLSACRWRTTSHCTPDMTSGQLPLFGLI
jgi:hypothetical protein